MKNNNSKHGNRLTNRRLLTAVAIVALVCFLAITLTRPYFDGVNSAVNLWATGIQTPGLTEAANLLSTAFDTKILIALSLPLVGLLLYKGYTEKAGLLVGAMGADALLLQGAKTLIVSPRPLNGLIAETDFSFPSGHVTSTIVFVGMLSYLVWENRKTISKLCIAAVGPALVAIVAFDRLYLNVHWLSDVLAAPFLGLFIIAATILIVRRLFRWYNKRQNQTQTAPTKGITNPKGPTLYGRAITNTPQTNTGVTADA
ncbi:MAG TPA: phosphatase PAP2 family protein [Candidatus Acidoferrales bacterium]|nr:phosphatase PAP2 family protein [Candidatus Acidoferrales bacterium]